MISAQLQEQYEAQADACLEAAECHHDVLVAYAERLAGSREAGLDLFQQACLNCHDAIQRRGFAGEGYQFYLLAALRHLHYERTGQQARDRTRPLPVGWEPAQEAPAVAQAPYAQLARQVHRQMRKQYAMPERLVWRLFLDGCSMREIAALVGLPHQVAVFRTLEKMRGELRDAFRPAWGRVLEQMD